jgi:hypothetical protein
VIPKKTARSPNDLAVTLFVLRFRTVPNLTGGQDTMVSVYCQGGAGIFSNSKFGSPEKSIIRLWQTFQFFQ